MNFIIKSFSTLHEMYVKYDIFLDVVIDMRTKLISTKRSRKIVKFLEGWIEVGFFTKILVEILR